MKHEWRKKEKAVYLPKNKPEIIEVPTYNYIVLSGKGNPNSDLFAESIGALYSVAYGIKMTLKKSDSLPSDYNDWTVYPLEGVWDISEEAKENYTGVLNKDDLVYDIMIRQPEFINQDFFDQILEMTKKKKPHPLLDKVRFEKISDGRCIQMLHIGSYDNEPESFAIMETFAKDSKLIRKSKIHREIYLSDFRKVPENKLKTVLRFRVE
ncbi:GyrI-like domain-containing protein [Flammeovirga sp. EKP202]|uniref:GyrI-like domain-containing protein n=1 Tax=Flammeovirga sp. EKP202 TaxID=2770592 RepID=UPI00165F05EF|nr:GyrI-like domain-containing protein [Flammeovirga sp. EKP202]MBD0401542.1 GyrI-like domain-containing protein [Flammeovirga sp. EKP202]